MVGRRFSLTKILAALTATGLANAAELRSPKSHQAHIAEITSRQNSVMRLFHSLCQPTLQATTVMSHE